MADTVQEKKPIGQAILDRQIKEFQIRDRRISMKLDDGATLEIFAGGKPLRLRHISPNGILEE